MQKTTKKYRLKTSLNEISIKPNYSYKTAIYTAFLIAVIGAVVGIIFFDRLSYNAKAVTFGIAGGALLMAVYNFLFKLNVTFIFDKRTNAIYKRLPPFPRQQLMSFQQMKLFTRSEYGGFEYAIGIKKRQFMKSHSISNSFGNNKKEVILEQEYVDYILNPILEFVGYVETEQPA